MNRRRQAIKQILDDSAQVCQNFCVSFECTCEEQTKADLKALGVASLEKSPDARCMKAPDLEDWGFLHFTPRSYRLCAWDIHLTPVRIKRVRNERQPRSRISRHHRDRQGS